MEEKETCTYCGGDLEEGRLFAVGAREVKWTVGSGDWKSALGVGGEVIARKCENCGLIQLKEKGFRGGDRDVT